MPSLNRASSGVIVILFLLVAGFFAWQATNFRIDASADTLLTKGNKLYLRSAEAAQTYDAAEYILIAFEPRSGKIFSQETLGLLENISQQIAKIERVSGVRSVANIPLFSQLSSLSGDVDPNSVTWETQHYSSKILEKALASHPLYETLFFNKEMTATSIQVSFSYNPKLDELSAKILSLQKKSAEKDLAQEEQDNLDRLKTQRDSINRKLDMRRAEEIKQLRKIVRKYEDKGNFYFGGGYLLSNQLIKIIKSDLVLFGSLIAVIVCILLFAFFRRPIWVLIPISCCALSVVCTVGLLGFLGLKVTVISTNVIALQIILTLAIVVHLIVQYNEFSAQDKSASAADLMNKTMGAKIKPCIYAALTTSIGFGSLIFSGVAPVISFGWMMVMAMIITMLVSLLLFPALYLLLSRRRVTVKTPAWVESLMLFLVKLCQAYPKAIVGVSAIVVVIGVAGCFRLSAETSFLSYFDKSTEVYRELSFIDKQFGGSTPLDVIYTVPQGIKDPNLIVSAEAVANIQKIHEVLDSHKAIGSVTSLADFAKIAKVTAGKPLTEYEVTALYRSLDKKLRESLFGAYYSVDKKQARISARVKDTTEGLQRSELVTNLRAEIQNQGIEASQFQLSNLFILYQDIISRLVDSQFSTLGIVYLAMAFVLLFVFRSIKISLICLVPNIVTTAIIMGTMGWLSIPLDLMTITIAAVAMGISVDDTIHYAHRFEQEQQQGKANPLKSTHISVGYALLYTTLIIIIGFSSLLLSDFVPSFLFGALTSIAMFSALLTDTLLLPPLLSWNAKRTGG